MAKLTINLSERLSDIERERDELRAEVERLRAVVEKLRAGVRALAHGEQSGRAFANTLLIETAADAARAKGGSNG